MAIQFCEALALQLQPESVDTSNAIRPPANPIASPLRLSENRHGAPAWLTSIRCGPTVIAPARLEGSGFAETVKSTDPSPCPVRVPLSDTQLASLVAVHVQSLAVDTATVPLPPVAVNAAALAVA